MVVYVFMCENIGHSLLVKGCLQGKYNSFLQKAKNNLCFYQNMFRFINGLSINRNTTYFITKTIFR
ncbi:hypothetical protein SAMN05444362_10474 [Dysgonomonas macrotermitis]|uniref:Uncharacterized protein n=1 Tax=Dysgonomonas macrotermitis TaxID=1346286 RepID=A0A1M4ZFB1_9BACT|nr:hypothetical protein SAMN05444362_10474 [Dysgonomonas macrotermitis]